MLIFGKPRAGIKIGIKAYKAAKMNVKILFLIKTLSINLFILVEKGLRLVYKLAI